MLKHSKDLGFCLGGCWDYHVVNTGLDRDANLLASASGFSQFQDPLDKDGLIRDKNEWEEYGDLIEEEKNARWYACIKQNCAFQLKMFGLSFIREDNSR